MNLLDGIKSDWIYITGFRRIIGAIGKFDPDAEYTVADAIEDAVDLVVTTAENTKVRVEILCDDRIGNIHADERRIKQVLFNLLDNAVKFTPAKGRIRIDVGVRQEAVVSISISDTGLGMSLAEIETAMSPFGQVDAGFNKRHEGTGLGLPIAYALARLHGGDLQIESKKGSGTRVTVNLPIAATAKPSTNTDHSLH